MTLRDDFFRVQEERRTAAGSDYRIAFHPEHRIYRAHFPGNPITPGVCIIQMVRELAEERLQRRFFLKKLHTVKFLYVINPLEDSTVTCSVSFAPEEGNACKISAAVYNGERSFAKLSLLLTPR